jgi:two-component system, response regulator
MDPAPQQKILRILIADDDPDDRQLAAYAFKEAKSVHTISFVKNGEELMEHLLHCVNNGLELPDLVLLDLNMPRMDGRAALREIKLHEGLHNLNVIIFSTFISEEDVSYTSSLGISQYITKPPSFFDLVDIFKNICDSLIHKGK